MTNKRQNLGFTMMEMLIAVAIVVILAALAFVAVINYQRSMKQLELDRIAQEIYVAAQNHLTQADAEGLLRQRAEVAEKTPSQSDEIIGKSHEREGEDGKSVTYHYFFKAAGDEPSQNTVLNDMLPPFSLDEGVRTNGSYAIEYDLDSATVINVFYSDQKDLSKYSFDYGRDYDTLFGDPGLIGPEHSQERRDGIGPNKDIIGWFGGDDVKGLTRTQLYKPTVELKNEERLYVKVSLPQSYITSMRRNTDPLLQVYIEGKVSGEDNRQLVKTLSGNERGDLLSEFVMYSDAEMKGGVAYRVATYVLDDVTDSTRHFATQYCDGLTSKNLIPGEDVKVWAEISSNSTLSNIAKSGETAWENSLYENVTVDDVALTATAGITNFRHLENLDPNVSAYSLKNESNANIKLTAAEQHINLEWSDFLSKTNKGNTKVYPIPSTGGTASKAGTYLPVNPYDSSSETGIRLASYDGQGHYIDGVKVDSDAAAVGLFGTLNGCSVTTLELRNFDVKTTSGEGAAGSLVGVAKGGSTLTSVLVRETDKATHTISGVGAGGLVGQLVASTVNGCAAATLVSATGEGSVAGGLVGISEQNSTITHSYAGGHTKDGVYEGASDSTKYNVINTGTVQASAGGLVGGAFNTSISYCYATTSVSAAGHAGGLVAQTTGGSITNCYATGLVSESNIRGAFVGELASSTSVPNNANNTYFGIINGDLAAVGKGSSDNITAFDTNMETFNAYIFGHESPVATPYDETLTERYNNVYPLKTIKEMDSNAPTSSLKITEEHFGDWPSPETLVINPAS